MGAGGWCIVTWHMLLDPTPPCVLQAAGRTPLFDQLIANRYSPGEGLSPHVDLLRFQVGARGEEGGGGCLCTWVGVEGGARAWCSPAHGSHPHPCHLVATPCIHSCM